MGIGAGRWKMKGSPFGGSPVLIRGCFYAFMLCYGA